MSDRRKRLLNELLNREYRETYAEDHVNSLLATQISTIREQRGLSQARLAELIGTYQSTISRIENVNYAKWSVATLRQVAAALGCWVNIRLESWGKLVEDASNYTVESLRREVIERDPVFLGSETTEYLSEPVRWVQAKVLPWLDRGEGTEKFRQWLLGRDFPPLGDRMPPFVWISRVVAAEPKHSRFRTVFADRLLDLWQELDEKYSQEHVDSEENDELYIGLFSLLAIFPSEEAWKKVIKNLYADGKRTLDRIPAACHSAFVSAVIRNQYDRSLENDWYKAIRTGKHDWLPANEFDAFEGIKRMTETPRLDAIARALSELYKDRRYTSKELESIMVELMEGLKLDFADQTFLADELVPWVLETKWQDPSEIKWQEPTITAWGLVFGKDEKAREAIINGVNEREKPIVKDAFKKSLRRNSTTEPPPSPGKTLAPLYTV